MKTHHYWGNIEEDWAGFSAEKTFSHPFFEKQDVTLFLGEEYDEDGEEIEKIEIEEKLDEFESTYRNFIENIETRLKDLQEKAFERYQKLYAHYYENSEKSGKVPLKIDTIEKHNDYLKELIYLRILEGKTIKLSIRYKLDTEHGIEFKFVDGKIEQIGGIATT